MDREQLKGSDGVAARRASAFRLRAVAGADGRLGRHSKGAQGVSAGPACGHPGLMGDGRGGIRWIEQLTDAGKATKFSPEEATRTATPLAYLLFLIGLFLLVGPYPLISVAYLVGATSPRIE